MAKTSFPRRRNPVSDAGTALAAKLDSRLRGNDGGMLGRSDDVRWVSGSVTEIDVADGHVVIPAQAGI